MVWGTLPQPPQPVILRPRPLQSNPGSFLLVPLLPSPKSATPLPAEIWTEIFSHVYYGEYNVDPFPNRHLRVERHRRDLLLICRALTVRLNAPLMCFIDDLLTLLLCWPPSPEHRPSRVLLPRADKIPLAIGEVHDKAPCRRQTMGLASKDTLLYSRPVGPRTRPVQRGMRRYQPRR